MAKFLRGNCFIDRPGFTRINLPYFMKKEEASYILESIVMIAEYGWKLLPKVVYRTYIIYVLYLCFKPVVYEPYPTTCV